ncbi:MAG: hypothetical protein HYW79_03365 [Parcubacteria group bacterium]|nr:hypothetical protein [Parcubacteria group bacterium]
MYDPWLDCVFNASQATRTVRRLHSRWMTQREINRCDDELAFAKNVETIKAHRDFLNRTLIFIQIRRWAVPLWPLWFFYRAVERVFVNPIPDEVKYSPKYW